MQQLSVFPMPPNVSCAAAPLGLVTRRRCLRSHFSQSFQTPLSQLVTNRLISWYSMGLIAFQPAKWTDPDHGEFEGLHKWCWIVLNLTSTIGWINQSTIVPSLQGLLWSSYCSHKRLITSPALPTVQFLNCFWHFSYLPCHQICSSASIR